MNKYLEKLQMNTNRFR